MSELIKSIFLIDDCPEVLECLSTLLTEEGFKVFTFSSALEAIFFVNNHPLSVQDSFFITDYEMKPVGALPLLAHLSQEKIKHQGTLVISGTDREQVINGITDLFVENCECSLSFMLKPFKIEQLKMIFNS